MKSTGIVRELDTLGRIVIPMELRRRYGLGAKDPIEIYTEGDAIILKKYTTTCFICNEADADISCGPFHICRNCLDKVIKEAKEENHP